MVKYELQKKYYCLVANRKKLRRTDKGKTALAQQFFPALDSAASLPSPSES
jgi:hypothetical protein